MLPRVIAGTLCLLHRVHRTLCPVTGCTSVRSLVYTAPREGLRRLRVARRPARGRRPPPAPSRACPHPPPPRYWRKQPLLRRGPRGTARRRRRVACYRATAAVADSEDSPLLASAAPCECKPRRSLPARVNSESPPDSAVGQPPGAVRLAVHTVRHRGRGPIAAVEGCQPELDSGPAPRWTLAPRFSPLRPRRAPPRGSGGGAWPGTPPGRICRRRRRRRRGPGSVTLAQ